MTSYFVAHLDDEKAWIEIIFLGKTTLKPKVLNGTHRFVEAETNSNFFHKNSSCFFETLEHESGPKIGESEQQEQLLRQVFSEQLAASCQRRQQRPQQVSGRNKTDTLAEKSQHFHSQARLTISKHPRSLDRSTDRTTPEWSWDREVKPASPGFVYSSEQTISESGATGSLE